MNTKTTRAECLLFGHLNGLECGSRRMRDGSTAVIPPWSPLREDAPLPEPLETLFPRAYFESFEGAPPSITTMRFFNERVARLRKRGLVPGWMPDQKFSPADLPHLLALAFAQGASGGLDLADIVCHVPKLASKLRDGVFAAGEALQSADSRADVLKAVVLLAATTMMGLPRLKFSPFFTLIHDDATNRHPLVTALFDWILEGIGEQAIMRMAELTWQNCAPEDAVAAMHFVHPGIDRTFEEIDALWNEALRKAGLLETSDNDGENVDRSANEKSLEFPRSPPKPKSTKVSVAKPPLPAAPDGVVISDRAAREIRTERFYAEERLADGLALLGTYRSMRLGRITKNEFREEAQRMRFAEGPCFADPGSLKAFKQDYRVAAGRKTFILDRHLKWGRGNNAISAIRIYFTWDAENQNVIVGSAPRHLPIAGWA